MAAADAAKTAVAATTKAAVAVATPQLSQRPPRSFIERRRWPPRRPKARRRFPSGQRQGRRQSHSRRRRPRLTFLGATCCRRRFQAPVMSLLPVLVTGLPVRSWHGTV